MDGINHHADPEVPADEIQLRLVAFQSGRPAAPTVVHLQRLVGMAQHSSGRTASRKETLRTVTDAADVVVKSWTAARESKSDEPEAQHLYANSLDSRDTQHIEIHPDRVIGQTCHYRWGRCLCRMKSTAQIY